MTRTNTNTPSKTGNGTITLVGAKTAYRLATGEPMPKKWTYSDAAAIAVDELGWDVVVAIGDAVAKVKPAHFRTDDGAFDVKAYDEAVMHEGRMAMRRDAGTHTL